MTHAALDTDAVAESFFASLENEMHYRQSLATGDKAEQTTIGYIEGYHNRTRPHSSIGYQIPAEVMDAFMQRCDMAFNDHDPHLLAA